MTTPRKLAALVLAGALAASSIVPTAADAKTYSDVPSNHWAYKVIDQISNQKIMVGFSDTIFSPSTKLTRAEYTAILYNMTDDKSLGKTTITFTDVPANAWYAQVAKWGISNDILQNGAANKFDGSSPVTREYMAYMTYSYIHRYAPNAIDISKDSSAGYTDQSSIASGSVWYVNVLSNNGLLAGMKDGSFQPKATVTRAEAAAIASRIQKVLKDGTTDPDGNKPVDPPTPVDPDDNNKPDPEQKPDPNENENKPGTDDKPSVDSRIPSWFVHKDKPNGVTQEHWDAVLDFYKDKEKPSWYPSSIPSTVTNLDGYLSNNVNQLYDQIGNYSKPTDPNENKPTDPDENNKPDPEEQEKPSVDSRIPSWMLTDHRPPMVDADQWEWILDFWQDRERPDFYPTSIDPKYKNQPDNYLKAYVQQLYIQGQEIDKEEKTILALESGDANLTAEEQKMVDLVNKARREAGIPELKVSPALCRAADIRAKEILILFSHDRPDGSEKDSVLEDPEVNLYPYVTSIGENATMDRDSTRYPYNEAFESFWNSKIGHRENMLDKKYKYIGVGKYSSSTQTGWVQVFSSAQG
ncbi:MAG: S-layer homology domain-containing protein [Peptococcaceae bacterium]|nr:S-layer homology domain-containing protein [Peptococcaceae bacterium]